MTATLTPPPPVVTPPAPADRSVSPLLRPSADLEAFRAGLVRFTWADVEKMWKAGILYEDSTIELLDGLLVYRDCGGSTRGPGVANAEHDWTVGRLGDLNRQLDNVAQHVRPQATLRLSETYSPIPDIMILRGPLVDYRQRQPTAIDVLCLIEVSDTSYARDSGDKLLAYAAAGVAQYIIVDLRRRQAEVYADPAHGTYPPPTIVAAGGALPLHLAEGQRFDLALADVLP